MGNRQHNTHIANDTSEEVRIVLTDSDGRNTTKVIKAGKLICIPTPHGRNSVDVFGQVSDSKGHKVFDERSVSNYTDDSDYSFIVKKTPEGYLDIVRSKYGSVWEEDAGLR